MFGCVYIDDNSVNITAVHKFAMFRNNRVLHYIPQYIITYSIFGILLFNFDIPRTDLLKDLHVPTRQLLCRKLNAALPLGGDFKELAELVGIPNDEIHFIATRDNPAEEVMSWWSPKPSATIAQLRDYLTRMQLSDLVGILDSSPLPCKLCFPCIYIYIYPFLSYLSYCSLREVHITLSVPRLRYRILLWAMSSTLKWDVIRMAIPHHEI